MWMIFLANCATCCMVARVKCILQPVAKSHSMLQQLAAAAVTGRHMPEQAAGAAEAKLLDQPAPLLLQLQNHCAQEAAVASIFS
jgi:hypothetical protein